MPTGLIQKTLLDPVACPRMICLYVDGYDASKDDWYKDGDSPYLDWTDAYIFNPHLSLESGNYTFEDTAATGTPTTTEVQLYCAGSTGTATVYIYDGSSWVEAGTVDPSVFPTWKTIDVSAILNTFTKINAAKMYIKYNA